MLKQFLVNFAVFWVSVVLSYLITMINPSMFEAGQSSASKIAYVIFATAIFMLVFTLVRELFLRVITGVK